MPAGSGLGGENCETWMVCTKEACDVLAAHAAITSVKEMIKIHLRIAASARLVSFFL